MQTKTMDFEKSLLNKIILRITIGHIHNSRDYYLYFIYLLMYNLCCMIV